MERLGRILLVEDDHRDVELSMTALEEYNLANEVVVARDGQQALDYLYCSGNFEKRPHVLAPGFELVFCQAPAHGLTRDVVVLGELDQLVGQEFQRPAGAALGWA